MPPANEVTAELKEMSDNRRLDPTGSDKSQCSNKQPPRKFGWLLTIVKMSVSAALLAWILKRSNLGDIFEALSHAKLPWLVLALVSPAVGILITSHRWGGLLRSQGVHVPASTLVRSCIVATFVRQFLPSTIGGDAVRGYDSWKAGASKSGAVAALVVDRILGLLPLVLFAAVTLCFPQELTRRYPLLYAIVAVGAAGLILITWFIFKPPTFLLRLVSWMSERLPSPMRRPLNELFNAVSAYRGKNRQLVRALILSFLLQINVVTFYWFLGLAMGFTIPYHLFYLIVPIAVLVMMVPVSINAVGVREGIFVFLLSAYGVDPVQGIAFAWLEHGLFLLYGVIGGIIYAIRKAPSREFLSTKAVIGD